ncbi:MAG: ZIP family metal transporter [Bacteroidota bacterium]
MRTTLLTQVLLYVLFPIAGTIIGALTAAIRTPGPLVRSAIQHFGAGVVFAAIAGELIPEAMHSRAPLPVAIGFALGVLAMFALRFWAEKREKAEAKGRRSRFGLIAAVGVDTILDGLVIGIGFIAGKKEGVLIVIALTLEMFFLGLTTAVTLLGEGAKKRKVILLTASLALMIGVGAALAVTILGGLTGAALYGVLAFGCATLLYLVTEELLIDAHSVKETPLVTSVFFAGFLLLLMLEMTV